jgi:1,5-anhydro-D-fructose reductase (1,5-anhydro-D-mannitol-forming)
VSDRKINWAIVGVGDIVRKRAGAAILQQPDSILHACVEIDPDARRAEIDSLNPRKVYANVQDMLADPAVDAVYIATPVHLHASQAIAALRAGKDVLVEKPMALSVAESAEVCRVARQSGRRLAVAYFRRFWPRFQLVKDMLDRGDFGQVVLVRIASHTWYAGKLGGWRERPELSGGGVLSDVGCHKFDLLAWWFGMPSRIVANIGTLTHDYKAEDSAVLLMTLAGGAQLTASFHWNSKTWTDEIHIVGTEARVAFHPCDGDDIGITVGRNTERRMMAPPENQHYPLVHDFARSLVEDRSPRFNGEVGLQATRIMEAVFDSARQNTWIEVN